MAPLVPPAQEAIDGHDAPGFQADVSLDDAPVVDDDGVGHHGVNSALGIGALGLRHAVANGLAAAKLDLFTVAASPERVVRLDLDQQVGVSQPQPVTNGGAKHFRISASPDRGHQWAPVPVASMGPFVRPRKP